MLYIQYLDLKQFIDSSRIFFGEGRGECGIALHLPIKNYMAGSAPATDYALMITVANHLIEFLLYKRLNRGPQQWDYNPEKAAEIYTVCGDNVSTSGIIIEDRNYPSGAKLQVFLDKTFGVNEVAIRWKGQMVGDERLLADYEEYLKEYLSDNTLGNL
ncbi:MAG: hypothetical protein ABIK54_02040 [candidate division WOR-3 bacterium]